MSLNLPEANDVSHLNQVNNVVLKILRSDKKGRWLKISDEKIRKQLITNLSTHFNTMMLWNGFENRSKLVHPSTRYTEDRARPHF